MDILTVMVIFMIADTLITLYLLDKVRKLDSKTKDIRFSARDRRNSFEDVP